MIFWDLLLRHREELAKNEKAGSSLVCRDYETVALDVLREVSKAKSRITALNLRGAGVCLFAGVWNTNALYELS